jgi:hypothetical protein
MIEDWQPAGSWACQKLVRISIYIPIFPRPIDPSARMALDLPRCQACYSPPVTHYLASLIDSLR